MATHNRIVMYTRTNGNRISSVSADLRLHAITIVAVTGVVAAAVARLHHERRVLLDARFTFM